MAVSGRRVPDFYGSFSKGSTEVFDYNCEPCLATGQYTESFGFCMDCEEYLCKTCFDYHQRTKASKHHQLLNKDDMDRRVFHTKSSVACIEKCHIHKNETIKFFCTNHEFLGCTDCITLNHRTCKIDYIPDKCAGIGDSKEYRETLRELDLKIQDLDAVIRKATLQDNDIDFFYDHVMNQIMKFRKEINARLDQLQDQVQTRAERKKSADKLTVNKVLETRAAVSSDIKQLKSSLQYSKSSQRNGQLYIMIKQAKAKLKSDAVKKAQAQYPLEQTSLQYTFERNKELENLLTKHVIFGKLSQPSSLLTSRKERTFERFTDRGYIVVCIKSDRFKCMITGAAVLSTSKLVLADNYNNKLKVVDTESNIVIEETSLESGPWDIAVLPHDQIAVTMPKKRDILIMTTAGKLSICRKIPFKASFYGITYHKGQLYTVCTSPLRVIVLDTLSNYNTTIYLDNGIFARPCNILVSDHSRHIYIGDYDSCRVVSITLEGVITAVYEHKDLIQPQGMTTLEDGSLLVCCLNGTMHHISGDLKQCKTIIDGLQFPYSICYNHQEQEVYIGGRCDKLMINEVSMERIDENPTTHFL